MYNMMKAFISSLLLLCCCTTDLQNNAVQFHVTAFTVPTTTTTTFTTTQTTISTFRQTKTSTQNQWVLVSHGKFPLYSTTTTTSSITTSGTDDMKFVASSSSSTSSTTSSSSSSEQQEPTNQETNSVVVGAGPAGLLTAIMLAQKLPKEYNNNNNNNSNQKPPPIQVYDRLSQPPSPTDTTVWNDVAKFYLIGLGSRGQNALRKYNVWSDVEQVCTQVVGRKDWSPESNSEEGVERLFTDRPVMTQVLPRDKLVGVLHEHIVENYSNVIQLNYGYEIVPESFGDEHNSGGKVKIRVSKCRNDDEATTSNTNTSKRPKTRGQAHALQSSSSPEQQQLEQETSDEECDIDESFTITTNLLIAADGTARTVANEMEHQEKSRWSKLNPIQRLYNPKPFQVKRYVDDNRRVYKTIPMKVPDTWRPDLNYSARTKDGRINYDALPADRNGNYCGVLLIRENDEFAKSDTDPGELRRLLDENLPQFSVLLDDSTVADIAKKPVSYLPSFRYAGPRLNMGDRTVILGDCAHTVK